MLSMTRSDMSQAHSLTKIKTFVQMFKFPSSAACTVFLEERLCKMQCMEHVVDDLDRQCCKEGSGLRLLLEL